VDDQDPYRRADTPTGRCPRCQRTITSDGDATQLSCPAGCGEWYAAGTIATAGQLADAKLDDTAGWPWGVAACPICRQAMRVRVRAEVRFDHCDAHGVWLDAGEYRRFVEAFRRR
jgi:TFIIB-like protein